MLLIVLYLAIGWFFRFLLAGREYLPTDLCGFASPQSLLPILQFYAILMFSASSVCFVFLGFSGFLLSLFVQLLLGLVSCWSVLHFFQVSFAMSRYFLLVLVSFACSILIFSL